MISPILNTMTKRLTRYLALPLLALMAACNDQDFVAPAFISVDAFKVTAPDEDAFTTDSGFYTSNVVAAQVVAAFPGDEAETVLGSFRLPFTIPVLYNGTPDYIIIYPEVAHSGVMSTLPYYSFYEAIRLEGQTLTSGDTLKLGTLTTLYDSRTDYPHIFEPFEPTQANIQMDSVEWIRIDREGACTGEGYGHVHVDPSATHAKFAINVGRKFNGLDFYVDNPQKIVYLELDIRSDLKVQVNMTSQRYEGINQTTEQVMVINPSDDWKHMYINLEPAWRVFNHNKSFSVSFSALNADGVGGDVYIDNVKLLTTAKTL